MPWTSKTKLAYAKVKDALCSSSVPQEREEAIRQAILDGVPLFQIEVLLDCLELLAQMESTVPAPIVPPNPGSIPSGSDPIPGSG